MGAKQMQYKKNMQYRENVTLPAPIPDKEK